VYKPRLEHPKRPVHGFNCTRSEVQTLVFCVFCVVMLFSGISMPYVASCSCDSWNSSKWNIRKYY